MYTMAKKRKSKDDNSEHTSKQTISEQAIRKSSDQKMATSTSSAIRAVNWNAKARLIYLQRGQREEECFKDGDLMYMKWEGREFGIYENEEEIPASRGYLPDNAELQQFLDTNSNELHHGDLLTTITAYRASHIFIVMYDDKVNRYKAVLNTDESGSGYLTIPTEVFKNVTNAMDKYKDVFSAMENEAINIHISAKDEFIIEKLGEGVDENWQFDLHIVDSEVQEAYVRATDEDEWQDFDVEDSSAEQLTALFESGEKTTFTVTVDIKDEQFEVYEQRYGWRQKPTLPTYWVTETGGSSSGSTHKNWDWIFKGPLESVNAAKEAVETFLKDFTYQYKEEDD